MPWALASPGANGGSFKGGISSPWASDLNIVSVYGDWCILWSNSAIVVMRMLRKRLLEVLLVLAGKSATSLDIGLLMMVKSLRMPSNLKL
jgi:hypothetical protein